MKRRSVRLIFPSATPDAMRSTLAFVADVVRGAPGRVEVGPWDDLTLLSKRWIEVRGDQPTVDLVLQRAAELKLPFTLSIKMPATAEV